MISIILRWEWNYELMRLIGDQDKIILHYDNTRYLLARQKCLTIGWIRFSILFRSKKTTWLSIGTSQICFTQCFNISCVNLICSKPFNICVDQKGKGAIYMPWCIPLSEPLSQTPWGHMHLFNLYAIIKATSPMSHIASLVASSSMFCIVLYLFIAVYY